MNSRESENDKRTARSMIIATKTRHEFVSVFTSSIDKNCDNLIRYKVRSMYIIILTLLLQ
jgi:hypothetical protein